MIKSQCREWCKEVQEKLLPGVRGCPLGPHLSSPQEWGIKGVDEIQVGEPVAGI